eukprot:m.259438 g.259438  ORF g.259438 m.259438 type:complete len:120 (-) comp54585_c0_seq11:402-761(-)
MEALRAAAARADTLAVIALCEQIELDESLSPNCVADVEVYAAYLAALLAHPQQFAFPFLSARSRAEVVHFQGRIQHEGKVSLEKNSHCVKRGEWRAPGLTCSSGAILEAIDRLPETRAF